MMQRGDVVSVAFPYVAGGRARIARPSAYPETILAAWIRTVAATSSRPQPRHRADGRCLQSSQRQGCDDQLEDVAPDQLEAGQVLDDHGVGAEQQVVRGVRFVIDRRRVDPDEVDPRATSQAAVASLSTG